MVLLVADERRGGERRQKGGWLKSVTEKKAPGAAKIGRGDHLRSKRCRQVSDDPFERCTPASPIGRTRFERGGSWQGEIRQNRAREGGNVPTSADEVCANGILLGELRNAEVNVTHLPTDLGGDDG